LLQTKRGRMLPPRFLLVPFLSLLAACSTPPAERTHQARPLAPSSAPAVAHVELKRPLSPAALPPPPRPVVCDSCYFSEEIDQRIMRDSNAENCSIFTTFEEATHQDIPELNRRITTWTPWLTNFCVLRDYLEPGTGTYARPVPLPNRQHRQLFLAGASEMILVEFAAEKFRFVWLGSRTTYSFGGDTSHALYYYPDAELLVLQNVNGAMGMGRGASGSASTWLQVYDIKQDAWLINTPIEWYNTSVGYTDNDETEHAGGEQTISRKWQLQAHGRTLRLGGYEVVGRKRYDDENEPDGYLAPTLTQQLREAMEEDTTLDKYVLPAGTYRLVKGQYRRTGR
jgi:hypothetical protein